MDIKIQTIITAIILAVILGGAGIYILTQVRETNVLTFYHWWISPGEEAAINALIDVFAEKYPDTKIISTPVISKGTGGGGLEMFYIIKPMILSGDAPDAFQMHAGYEGKIYFDAGLLESVDDIWESKRLEKVTPKIIQTMCKFEGHYYSVPINIHRTNVVWYNKELLDKNNINPSDLTTWDKFFDACDKLKKRGIEYPIQMGTAWTAQHTFDQIIASIGIDFYEDWVNGKVTSEYDSRLLKAFEIFKKYLSYVNPDNTNLDWDKATERIILGEGAFNIMGDWANGEFKAAEKVYDRDYGTFAVPNTYQMYGLCIDAFQRPKNIQHPKNAEKWLKVVASKEGQDAFNPIKGSISARIDTNRTKYDSYQQSAIFDFWKVRYMFPAISNGLPKDFEEKEQEVIAEFAQDLDINKAAKEITDYTKKTSKDYTIKWELDIASD